MDTLLKRSSAINLLMPFGRWLPPTDGNDLDDAGERGSVLGLYASVEEDTEVYILTGMRMAAGAAILTGILQPLIRTNVKPVPQTQQTQTSWAELVRQAEGPREYARRNRYVAYSFGGGRGPKRQFWAE